MRLFAFQMCFIKFNNWRCEHSFIILKFSNILYSNKTLQAFELVVLVCLEMNLPPTKMNLRTCGMWNYSNNYDVLKFLVCVDLSSLAWG